MKQHLAALKHDWLVTGHVLEMNTAQAVRGSRYSQTSGKTPVLEKDEARRLLESIDASSIVGARDKALLAVIFFVRARRRRRRHARPGLPRRGHAASFPFHEKNGKDRAVPAHHLAAEYLDACLALSGLAEQPDAPLWRRPLDEAALSGHPLSARAASPSTW